jgi:hypothetical protein
LNTIEIMCNDILGNYSKEDQLMIAAFGSHSKRRLNRVLDALNFDYPDYEQLGGDAGGPKGKRIVSALDEESTKLAKKKKEISEKLSPEPKVAVLGKIKAVSPKPASPKPKTSAQEEETPATPSAVEVEEILKVMTEPLPVKLSPLAPELTKFFQKGKEASAAESPAKPKKRRIIQVADVIHQTPPPISTSKIVIVETTRAETSVAEATGAEATKATTEAEATKATTENPNLETTLDDIDNMLLRMAEEEAVVAAVNTATEKGKERIEDILEEGNFNFQDILGQELTDAEKEELKKYAISCGYKPGSLLFGGVNEGKLRCLWNRTEAKVVRTFSKSVGLPKIEADLCRYQRQHIAGSLLYANFKVKNSQKTSSFFLMLSDEGCFDRAYY